MISIVTKVTLHTENVIKLEILDTEQSYYKGKIGTSK